MTGSHDPVFVVLSLIIAALASYAALDLAGRVRSAEGATRFGWLIGGATVMGLGIWSMHFVAMLAFHLPTPIAYDPPRMLLSVAVAIGASLLALTVVSRAELRFVPLVLGGGLMGAAIAGMHYIGMESMRVGADLTYNPPMVMLSVAIAIVASITALGLAFNFRTVVSRRDRLLKSASAVVMGVAIAGMHYTAMAAASFIPARALTRQPGFVIATNGLGAAVTIGTLLILVLAIVGAVIDRNIQSKIEFARQLELINAELQRSLDDAERARSQLAAEHAAYTELQAVAQEQAAKTRWLEGIAETTTAIAHEVNNPLTSLIINAELLDQALGGSSETIAAIQAAARRIARVIIRLNNVSEPRSVTYIGKSRMIDLSPKDAA